MLHGLEELEAASIAQPVENARCSHHEEGTPSQQDLGRSETGIQMARTIRVGRVATAASCPRDSGCIVFGTSKRFGVACGSVCCPITAVEGTGEMAAKMYIFIFRSF